MFKHFTILQVTIYDSGLDDYFQTKFDNFETTLKYQFSMDKKERLDEFENSLLKSGAISEFLSSLGPNYVTFDNWLIPKLKIYSVDLFVNDYWIKATLDLRTELNYSQKIRYHWKLNDVVILTTIKFETP